MTVVLNFRFFFLIFKLDQISLEYEILIKKKKNQLGDRILFTWLLFLVHAKGWEAAN